MDAVAPAKPEAPPVSPAKVPAARKPPGLFLTVIVPLLAAALSLVNLVLFKLENIMRPSWPEVVDQAWFAAFAVIVVAVAVAMWGKRRWLVAVAVLLVLAAGFLPRVADFYAAEQQQAVEQAEGAEAEMEFQVATLTWSDDVAARIAEKRPYTVEEGLDFLDYVVSSDLSWRSLPDHTPEARALVEEALAGGVLDPNAITTGAPVADSATSTLTLQWYDTRIRPGSPSAIDKHAWDVLLMLVGAGADIAADGADALRADLAKTVIAGEGRFIRLEWGEEAETTAEPAPAAPAAAPGDAEAVTPPAEPAATAPAQ